MHHVKQSLNRRPIFQSTIWELKTIEEDKIQDILIFKNKLPFEVCFRRYKYKDDIITGSTLLNGWKYILAEVNKIRPGLQTSGVIRSAVGEKNKVLLY